MLDVAQVVVEGAVFASCLESAGVLDHFVVQMVDVVAGNNIFDDHQAIAVEMTNGCLQVSCLELLAVQFTFGGLDNMWQIEGARVSCECAAADHGRNPKQPARGEHGVKAVRNREEISRMKW